MINFNRISIAGLDYRYVKPPKSNFNFYSCNQDTVHFTSNFQDSKLPGDSTAPVLPDDIEFNTIKNIQHNSPGVIKTVNSGYLAQIFKYRTPEKNIYAIKKPWPDKLKKHSTADPIKQLYNEVNAYVRLGNIDGIPRLYGHSNEFDESSNNPDNIPENHFLILEWVEGKPVSSDGTFYDFKMIDKSKLEKIYNLMSEFDKKGVLHNDLWASNILFTDKDVNIIDFNRSELFDHQDGSIKTNLDSFKERFLWRYLSDVYTRDGKNFLDKYKEIHNFEINLLKQRAEYEKQEGRSKNFNELFQKVEKLENLTDKELREKAVKEIFLSDIRCGKIYARYFEFEKDQSEYSFANAKKIMTENPDIISNKDYKKILSSNINALSSITEAIELAKDHDMKNCLKKFEEAGEMLDKYPDSEKQEEYFNKLAQFTNINIEFLKALEEQKSPEKARGILENNEKFFNDNKKITYYYKVLNTLTKEDNAASLASLKTETFKPFWDGEVVLTGPQGQPIVAQILPTRPEDSEQIDKWFNDTEKPHYQDETWHEWWVDNIRNTEQRCKVFKLTLKDEILGIMMVEPSIKSHINGEPITLVRGIRISPYCNKTTTDDPKSKGAGTALITYALIESAKANDDGIGINSSKGVEGFYQNILGDSNLLAPDGIRTFFSVLNGKRKEFLTDKFNNYKELKDKIS